MKSRWMMLTILATLLLSPVLALAQTDSDMLERTLGGVVTVAIYKAADYNKPFGFGASDAYEQLLNLSGATESGSGFCVEENGKKYIVTNCHVIEGAADDAGSIVSFSTTRTKYPMHIVGADSFIDIAVLEFADKQPGDDEIKPLKFTTDTPRLGQKVFAIGNPYGDYPYAVSDGIIGGLNRVRNGDLTGKYGYLESTATIIWGNSGGPLVNEAGDVVGVNTGIEIRTRFNQLFIEPQINFALEASKASRAVDDIIATGRARRAYLGVRFSQDFGAPKTDTDPEFIDLGAKPIIADVLPDSPAAAALTPYKGAVVTKVNDQDVTNIEEILAALETMKPGDDCTLWLDQDGNVNKVTFKTDELTQDRESAWAQHLLSNCGWTASQTDSGVTVQNVVQDNTPAPSNLASTGDVPQPPTSQYLRTRLQQFIFGTPQPAFQPVAPAAPAGPPVLSLIALGLFDDQGKPVTVWKVNSLKDLGVAVRLAALEGRVDMGVKGDQDKISVMRVWLSGEEGKLSRSLLY
jgi:S1-C subfamily serine protease